VPPQFRDDYLEACLVLAENPKSAAAIAGCRHNSTSNQSCGKACETQAGALLAAQVPRDVRNLVSLNTRVIAPGLKKAGIDWRGYYPCRRGISSLMTDASKNALNSTGLLRHSTPITALKHYTRAQKESIKAALEQVEEMAAKADETLR
jgi:hypothetical protein